MAENSFKCPICNKVMEAGVIYSDRYALRWISKEHDKGFLFPFGGVKLTKFLEKSYVDAYICKDCKKVIIDYDS